MKALKLIKQHSQEIKDFVASKEDCSITDLYSWFMKRYDLELDEYSRDRGYIIETELRKFLI